MKFLLVLAFLAQSAGPTYVYPVRVQIVYETYSWIGTGSGQANLYDESLGMRGVDFRYKGCRELRQTGGTSRDQARWHSSSELVILNPATGRECAVDITFHSWVYVVRKDGTITTEAIGKDGQGDKRYQHQ